MSLIKLKEFILQLYNYIVLVRFTGGSLGSMIELGFRSSRNVHSAIYESSLVLHAEKGIQLGPYNVMKGGGIPKKRGVGVPRKQGT